MNKRGQVFLMAAIIIVGVIVGVSSISTDALVGDSNEAFYDLSEEVGFETKRVLDYGVLNQNNAFSEVEGFFLEYQDYIAREQVVFVVGDSANMKVYYFFDNSGEVGISTGGGGSTFNILISDFGGWEADVSADGTSVNVKIDEVTYTFDLRDGENFFFVIIKHEEGEKFVATG
jgi:hypothetical protein